MREFEKYIDSMRRVAVQHEAEKHFRRCLANNPGHSGANQYLARILTQDKRRRQNAAEYYQKGKLHACTASAAKRADEAPEKHDNPMFMYPRAITVSRRISYILYALK